MSHRTSTRSAAGARLISMLFRSTVVDRTNGHVFNGGV
jgi:hypothetical protein